MKIECRYDGPFAIEAIMSRQTADPDDLAVAFGTLLVAAGDVPTVSLVYRDGKCLAIEVRGKIGMAMFGVNPTTISPAVARAIEEAIARSIR